MVQETYLITGAGTGFGKGIAFGLAEQGKKVIAGVETMSEKIIFFKSNCYAHITFVSLEALQVIL